MTTEAIVKRLVQLIHEGKNVQAEEELYAEDIVSYEQDGRVERGLENIVAKTKAAGEHFEAFHGVSVSEVFLADDNFLLKIEMDATPKGGERMQMHEYGAYTVKNGKIDTERFYMQPAKL